MCKHVDQKGNFFFPTKQAREKERERLVFVYF